MRSVGIDIGTFSAKVCVIEATKKGIFFQNFHEHVFQASNPLDKNLELIEFLRRLFGQDPSLQTRFVCSLPQDHVSVHSKIFPFKDRIKIFRSLPFEMEEDTPFNPDETLYDGRLQRLSATHAEVLACACPKESVKKFLQLMIDSGVSPQLMTPEGFALANHFEKWMEPPVVVQKLFDSQDEGDELPPPRQGESLLQIGHTKSLLLTRDDNGLIDIRTLSWGGENIAKAIEIKYSLTPAEAGKQVRSNGFILTTTDGATTDQVVFSNVIAGAVQEFIKELRLTILDIQSRHNIQIQNLTMTGGTSRIQNLAPFLTQGLEIPVNKLNLLSLYPNIQFEQTPHTNAVAGTALGLALEGLRKPRNPAVSLLRSEYAVQSHALKYFIETWGNTLKFAAGALVLFYIYTGWRASSASSMVETADEIMRLHAGNLARLKGGKASEAGIEKFIQKKRKEIKELKDLESFIQMNSALEVLKTVNDAAPNRSTLRMEIRRFSVKDQTVQMEGYVASAAETELLRKALTSLAKEQKVNSVPTQFDLPAGKIAFGFRFDVDRNITLQKGRPSNRSVSQ